MDRRPRRPARARLGRSLLVLVALLLSWPIGVGPARAEAGAWSMELSVLLDPSRSLTLADILAAEPALPFRQLDRPGVTLGFTTTAAWLRLTVTAPQSRQVLMSLGPNFVDLVDVHLAGPTGFIHRALGDHRPVPVDALSGLSDVVPLELRAGAPTVVYIRIAAVNSALGLSIDLYAPQEHTFRVTVAGLAYGGWFGGMAVMLVIQLVFYHFDRKPYYALLALATLMAMLVYTGTLGLSRLFLFPQGGVGNDIFTAGTSWLGLTASALAGASILDLKRQAPLLNRIVLGGAAVGVLGIPFVLLGANLYFADVANLTIILLSTLAAGQSLRTARQDGVATGLRAAAFCVLWAGLMATIAQRAGLGALPEWVSHSYAVSCLVQTILLTGSLGVRLRTAEALNRTMQDEALAGAKAAELRAMALVEARTRELAAAKQTAEDALAAELGAQRRQVQFMEVISHQYRTPLAAIRFHVDNIGLSLPETDEANRRRLDRVRRGIVRLVEVLEVNLSRSRLHGSAFRPEMRPVRLADIASEAAKRGRDLLQHDIVTRFDTDPADPEEGPQVMADDQMLGIAVINLLENAAKYSGASRDAPIILSCGVSAGRAVIAVEDEGVGIPQAELSRIFDRSVRGSTAADTEGLGLGLSLVSRIVAAHGGTVEIDSAPGRGTRVRLRLPLMVE